MVAAPKKVTLSNTSLTLNVNDTFKLKAKVNSGSHASYTWASSNKSVATVSKVGDDRIRVEVPDVSDHLSARDCGADRDPDPLHGAVDGPQLRRGRTVFLRPADERSLPIRPRRPRQLVVRRHRRSMVVPEVVRQ